MSRKTFIVFLLTLFWICCEGFDLTFNHFVPDTTPQPTARRVCGILKCIETLAEVDQSDAALNNRTRTLTSFSLYKTRLGGDGTRGPWQKLASLTPRHPSLNRVSDGMKISGQLSDQQATVSLELVKSHDCLESQFSCVVVSVDNQGQTSVKKSVVGKALDSQADYGPQFQEGNAAMPFGKSSVNDQSGSAALTQFLGLKLDWVQTGLMNSLKNLENKLDDKVTDIRAALDDKIAGLNRSMESRFGQMDVKITNLQNRLEDKLVESERRLTEALRDIKLTNSGTEGLCDPLTSKLDNMEAKQEANRKQLDRCVSEVIKLSNSQDNATEKVFDRLTTLTTSMQIFRENFTSFDDQLERLESAAGQCSLSVTGQNDKLAEVESTITSLSGITQNLVTSVDTFREEYSGGALVPVDEFFDLSGTGNKDWRLAFRGTPYIDVKIYPAYMHGTGIPIEVEEGCKQFNQSLPCTNHYRNSDAFNSWSGIDQVLFAVYKGDRMVHRVIFNGKGSSFTTWFSPDRIVESTWVDLTSKKHAVFSIFGEKTSAVERRFFMHFDYPRGCAGFRGWFYAGDLHGGCTADQTDAVPQFRYATGNTLAVYASQDSARADAIGIFLKYE
ncbi:hypothetical protein ElyMa_003078200 [Elysia marginata]|uniref:Fibrinogen C-terminal domain-containing protein n=1 Tax=Elysia marginata TaxID=1093978 RepID=A0AAV4IKT8_9GAST|nr:hypothetical protein ElyMa_003078200 [Elysia marginata]